MSSGFAIVNKNTLSSSASSSVSTSLLSPFLFQTHLSAVPTLTSASTVLIDTCVEVKDADDDGARELDMDMDEMLCVLTEREMED